MAHDRSGKDETQDDGEYHFSDDQASYEVEPEPAKPTASARMAANLVQYKKPAIGLGVFFVIIFLVYKILAPSTPTTNPAVTGFSANNPTMPVSPPTAKHHVTEGSKTKKTAEEVATNAAALPLPSTAVPAPGFPAQVIIPSTAPDQANMMPMQASAPPIASTPTGGDAVSKVAALEEQSTKLQADYTQKMADMNTQFGALQGKLQDLNLRLASIETTLTRLSQGVHQINKQPTAEMDTSAPPQKAVGPKMVYVVQAIIPGRAWLKADNGETVTVAEGDVLKDFGRVMKIDPYDGVVQVDIGGKTISLSYGAGAE